MADHLLLSSKFEKRSGTQQNWYLCDLCLFVGRRGCSVICTHRPTTQPRFRSRDPLWNWVMREALNKGNLGECKADCSGGMVKKSHIDKKGWDEQIEHKAWSTRSGVSRQNRRSCVSALERSWRDRAYSWDQSESRGLGWWMIWRKDQYFSTEHWNRQGVSVEHKGKRKGKRSGEWADIITDCMDKGKDINGAYQ